MDQRLRDAARAGNVDILYELIREDPMLLEHIDKIPFIDTPLHIAAAAGESSFVEEMMMLKPSFGRKLNQDGFSPLHLALQREFHDIAHKLACRDSGLIRVKGRGGSTPLHYEVEQRLSDLIGPFLSLSPDSIEDLTNECESALHIAVKSNNLEVLKLLVRWLKWIGKEDIMNWGDKNGDTILHIAISTNQPVIVKFLLSREIRDSIMINITNNFCQTALDVFHVSVIGDNKEVGDMLLKAKAICSSSPTYIPVEDCTKRALLNSKEWVEYFGQGIRKKSVVNDNRRNSVLVVAALIAATTFQAAISPPGGVWQDYYEPHALSNTNSTYRLYAFQYRQPHHAGQSVMSLRRYFIFFIVNSAAFYGAVISSVMVVNEGVLFFDMLVAALLFLSFTYYYSIHWVVPLGTYAVVDLVLGGILQCESFIFFALFSYLSYLHFQRFPYHWKRHMDVVNRRVRSSS